ncbi:MAG: CRISPR-associated helicase/endonuclease Cas3, partial [Gemmatimonadota bacterium]|nr:CRISPR-associated helicase/endonuclease Cas3 [Gemmatimonadota bacterium]
NLARAVIVLDEAQAIPVDFLAPCLRAIEELTRNYGASVVLCTATQPAVARRSGFDIGLDIGNESEIVPDPGGLHRALQRVSVTVERQTVRDSDLASRLVALDQVLCIVNTRRHAQELFDLLGPGEGDYHLSGFMCPEHRSARLGEIRRRLEMGLVCRVISTQLVEAGVDLDFPVVYRSMAGLDSIAQAAGRCNREGERALGHTIVFESEHRSSEAFLRDTAAKAREILPLHDDPLSPEAVEHFFRLYYWDQSDRWDHKKILGEFHLDRTNEKLPFLFGFARAAERFRLIEDTGRPIIVPWGEEGEALCDRLRNSWGNPPVKLRRKLQRYTVQVPLQVWARYRGRVFEMVHDEYPVLISTDTHYSNHTGLRLDERTGVFLSA